MPASVKYREKSNTYSSRNAYYNRAFSDRNSYLNTSTAYDIPAAYPERVRTVKKPVKDTRAVKAKAPSRTKANLSILRACVLAVVFIALCFVVIYRQTVILEDNQEIKKLEKQYSALLATNQAMQSKIDLSLEMGEVEKYAKENLGMMTPETGQVFYIDMQMEDVGELAGEKKSEQNAITGIQGTLVNAFRVLK